MNSLKVTANSTNSTKKMGFSIDSIVGNSGAESAASKLRDSLNMSPTDLSLSAAAKRFKSDHHTMDHTRFEFFDFIRKFWLFAETFVQKNILNCTAIWHFSKESSFVCDISIF